MTQSLKGEWAMILGASSGFGEAVALELSKRGMNIIGVHLDRKGTLAHVEEVKKAITDAGGEAPMKRWYHHCPAASRLSEETLL